MIKINLLPYRAARKKELIARQVVIALLPLVLTCLIIGFFWWSITTKTVQTQNDIDDIQAKIRQSKLKMKDIETFKEQKETLAKKMDIISTLKKNKTGPVRMLDAVASCLPGNVWLTSLNQKGTDLVLDGQALDNLSISRYMVQLENSDTFSDIELGEIKTEAKASIAGGGASLKKFKMKSKVTYNGDAAAPST